VILPLVVLRRLGCVLDPAKDKVLETATKLSGKVENLDPLLRQAAGGEQFYNTSPLTVTRLLDDPSNIADNPHACLRAFSPGAADVLEKFDLPIQVDRLVRADLLSLVISKFCEIDLHPEAVSNLEMGYLYEWLCLPRQSTFGCSPFAGVVVLAGTYPWLDLRAKPRCAARWIPTTPVCGPSTSVEGQPGIGGQHW
jgi:hypothetical protein